MHAALGVDRLDQVLQVLQPVLADRRGAAGQRVDVSDLDLRHRAACQQQRRRAQAHLQRQSIHTNSFVQVVAAASLCDSPAQDHGDYPKRPYRVGDVSTCDLNCSRNLIFCILPVAPRGIESTNTTSSGTCHFATLPSKQPSDSSLDGLVPGFFTITTSTSIKPSIVSPSGQRGRCRHLAAQAAHAHG